MSKPPVCFVAPWVYPIITGDRDRGIAGGAEVQQAAVARGLAAAGYSVSFLTADFGQPDDVGHDGLRFIKVWRETQKAWPGIRYFHPRLTGLWGGMKRAAASIYYVRGASAFAFVAAQFARRHGARFVFAAAHDLNFEKPRTHELFAGRGAWRDRHLFVAGMRRADALVAQHFRQVESARRWYGRDAEWIPSCYQPPKDAGCDAQGVVLWVSMLRDWKRPQRFIDLARALPHLRFRMIGGVSVVQGSDEEGRRFYKQIAAVAQSVPNIEFVGFVPPEKVERHFSEACLFVNTSDHEGFPNTFLQAWARGIPTVSFIDCGARDAQGPIGVIVPDDAAMRMAVERLATDPIRWTEEGERCRRHFENYHSVPAVVARYDALFRKLTEGHGEQWR